MILATAKVVSFDSLDGTSLGVRDNLYEEKTCLIDIEKNKAIDIKTFEEFTILEKKKGRIVNKEQINFKDKFVVSFKYINTDDYYLLDLLKMYFSLKKAKKSLENKKSKSYQVNIAKTLKIIEKNKKL